VISRRTFLVEGARAAAALAAAPSIGRACGSDGAEAEGAPPGVAPIPASGSAICDGATVPRGTVVVHQYGTPLHPESLARFVDALPIPPVLAPDGTRPDPDDPRASLPFYRVAMRETEVKFHRDLPPTRVWAYGGAVPGPTFETRSGRGLLVEWANELPEHHFLPIDHSIHGAHADAPEVRTVVHVHGAKAPPGSDGYPEDWYTPGHSATYHYPNRQDAATLWYHDHAMGIERLNQYAGLFGVFLVRDDAEDALRLPSGRYEIPLVVCDRLFEASGQLRYPVADVADAPWVENVQGDVHLINGKLFPFLEVEPRRYRFRMVNASNGRFYFFSLSGSTKMVQIGTDQGLLPAPVPLTSMLIAPAERADIVIDFSEAAGQTVSLLSQTQPILEFRVAPLSGPRVKAAPLPSRLRTIAKLAPATAAKTRVLTLNDYKDRGLHRMLMLLNGTFWREPVTETPELDSVEIWSFLNTTEDSHPIHLHLVRFQILDRQTFDDDEYLATKKLRMMGPPLPPAPEEEGWKDTVQAPPGIITRIIARFEGYAGRYVWHCHVLEHAANEMMRPFEVVAPAKAPPLP
jgi:spore coat protein A, manganese oxidase